MALFIFYVDVPASHPTHQKIKSFFQEENQLITDLEEEADFVIRPLGYPTWTQVERLIIVGDFSQSQLVPSASVCVDINTGMVQMPGGRNISFKHYVREWLITPMDAD